MNKTVIIFAFLLLCTLYAANEQNRTAPLPIMIPKQKIPPTCQGIPTMLLILPPPLEKDYSKCRSMVHKPSLSLVTKKIKDAKKVDVVDGFENLYKVITKSGKVLFCNESVSQCIENGKMVDLK